MYKMFCCLAGSVHTHKLLYSKTTMRYYFTLVRMAIINKSTNNKCWKQRKCPSINEWIKKPWYIYTMEYYAAEKKELLPLVTA